MNSIRERGLDELRRRITLNLQDLISMIEWNEKHGIKVFKISSDLFPIKPTPM